MSAKPATKVLRNATDGVFAMIIRTHRFKVGQTVHYTSGPYRSSWRGGVFKIMQLLPPQGGDYQYRIKSADEPHDRVVKESELDRAM